MEDEKEGRLARAKRHLNENKKVYLVGVGCFAAGYLLRQPRVITIINETAPAIAPTFNNTVAPVISPVIEIVNTVNNGGHCCKIVQDLETGKLWPKAKVLAEEISEEYGISFDAARVMLSKHLNGHSNDVFGKQYSTYGLGTTG